MKFVVYIPTRSSILKTGIDVKIAGKGTSWSESQLGKYAKRSGVYIHHSANKIIYVGKTTKKPDDNSSTVKSKKVIEWANFSGRLRREFQKSSSRNSRIYKLLRANQPIKTVMFDLDKIDGLIPGTKLSKHRKALIVEQAMIEFYAPLGNLI